jgi:hypothetical protein
VTEHTKEPWNYHAHGDGTFCLVGDCGKNWEKEEAGDHQGVGEELSEADAMRAVRCVNACTGIKEPEKLVPEALNALEFVWNLLDRHLAAPEGDDYTALLEDLDDTDRMVRPIMETLGRLPGCLCGISQGAPSTPEPGLDPERAAACVRACREMVDPEKDVDKLVDALTQIRDLLRTSSPARNVLPDVQRVLKDVDTLRNTLVFRKDAQTLEDKLEVQALQDFQRVVGKMFWAYDLHGYSGEDSIDVDLKGEPVLVRIDDTDVDSILHWNGEWLDPYWDVEVLTPVPEVPGLRSCWIHGHSYNTKTPERQQAKLVPCVPPAKEKP